MHCSLLAEINRQLDSPEARSEANQDRANRSRIDELTSILADLDAAIAKLPESQGSVGRVTRWTAKALKGKVLMYAGEYPTARLV